MIPADLFGEGIAEARVYILELVHEFHSQSTREHL